MQMTEFIDGWSLKLSRMDETDISELRTLLFVLVLQSEKLHNLDNRVFNRKNIVGIGPANRMDATMIRIF